MENPFGTLPTKGIIFIDTCAFTRSSAKIRYHTMNNEKEARDFLIEETFTLNLLEEELSKRDNWLTTQGVIEEFDTGTRNLAKLSKTTRDQRVALAAKYQKNQRDKFRKLLSQEHINADANLTEDLSKIIDSFLIPAVSTVFSNLSHSKSNSEVDCRLISTAIAFARYDPVFLFSYDGAVLGTYSIYAQSIQQEIQPTYVIRGLQKKVIIPTKYYISLAGLENHLNIQNTPATQNHP